MIKRFVLGEIGTNCYIVNENKNAFIVDPGDEDKEVLEYIKTNNLKVKFILLTHTHIDHVLGVNFFKEEFKIPVFASVDAKLIYDDSNYNLNYQFGKYNYKVIIDDFLKDGDELSSFSIKALSTPGHSLDSMSFVYDNNIFVGDTIFRLSIGRTDFPGGNFTKIKKSINEKILVNSDTTILYPGHGELTSVGFERKNNPFLKR
ncbi:MAG: MBL fold metallo-hydrolase [Peptoniphilaceae bacterium]|nr:MBL fold metallo-hydrolase [Peptoniphilaceae bacterium]MDD7383457.1 MBL fold metallo-hydrolase [Peptoniphilaceae bacterium]MDY3738480.1 MBL fold metallo-hydrolase [Peptoniphilaceae bacterium]